MRARSISIHNLPSFVDTAAEATEFCPERNRSPLRRLAFWLNTQVRPRCERWLAAQKERLALSRHRRALERLQQVLPGIEPGSLLSQIDPLRLCIDVDNQQRYLSVRRRDGTEIEQASLEANLLTAILETAGFTTVSVGVPRAPL